MLCHPRRSTRLLAVAMLMLWAAQPVTAQSVWEMPTEYPASSMPGEGIAAFATSVASKTGGKLTVQPSYGADKGIKSGQMMTAVRDGKIQAGDAFGGALDGINPAFGLSSLPFVASSIEDAQRLATAARPFYEKVLAAYGLKLLYTTPWPPTGLWSKTAITGAANLKDLPVRTYDATSTRVLAAAGAQATNLSFADVMPKLKDGSVLAVLSSGDGGAGRNLWQFLPHFTELNYAMPLSFAFVSRAAYEALPPDERTGVDLAAAETEARQWAAIRGRLEVNYARMRENGVIIATVLDPAVRAMLIAAALPVIEAWRQSAGAEGAAVLAAFQAR